MITNEHIETLPSSCSSTSSSCSSSASTTGSSSISTLSSTPGTGSSSTTSSNSSPSTSNNTSFINKQEQLAFDFHIIMNDLKNVCGTLNVLARQIDQIVNKMDDKFNLIVENLNSQQIEDLTNLKNSQRNVNNKTTKLSDLIKCANSSNNEPIYSNNINKSTSPTSIAPNLFFQNTKSKIKSSNYANPNEALLANLINENYATILNTQSNKVNRTFSDRKPLYFTTNSVSDDLKKNFNFSFNGPANAISNTNTNKDPDTVSVSSNQTPRISFNKINTNQTYNINKTRCIRSKSQPAFVKPENIDYHSFILNNNVSKVTTTTTKNIIDSNNNNNDDENKNAQANDSSFYEDQLDNELESFDNSSKLLLANLSTIKYKKDESNKPTINSIINNTTSTSNSTLFESINGSISKAMTPNLKSSTGGRTRSSNSNHHVSFNINNAIYTSRQETPIPIPISILKQTNHQVKLFEKPGDKTESNSKYVNLGNGPVNLLSFPSSLTAATTSITNSPMQSSIKRQSSFSNPATILISEQQQQNLQQIASDNDASKMGQPLRALIANNSNANNNNNNSNKSVRIDTKTTIL